MIRSSTANRFASAVVGIVLGLSAGLVAAELPVEPSAARIVAPSPSFPSLGPKLETEPDAVEAAGSKASRLTGPAVTMASSLAVVLGLFAAVVWASRRFNSKQGGRGELPAEAVEQLGSHTLDPRTRLLLVRCGDRVLVMAQTATGMHPISEISDPHEVGRLIARCRGETSAAFASTLRSIEREPTATGFVGSETVAPAPRRTLFATA